MTIYYVNPWTGSNTNTGLSWAQAWQWPPGNGAAVAPGDEIRIAQSSTRLGPSPSTNSQVSYVERAGLGSGNCSWFHTSYAVANTAIPTATAQYSGYSVDAGTTIPSNTKLVHWYFTSATHTLGTAMEIMLSMYGVPHGTVGQYLKVVFCSDTNGNTPVLTLTGPTCYSIESTYTGYANAIVSFEHDQTATYNFTVASVAIYSIASFTAPTTGMRLSISPPRYKRNTTLTGHIRAGDFIVRTAPVAPTQVTMGKSFYDGTAVLLGDYVDVVAGSWRTNRTTSEYIQFNTYVPLPWLGSSFPTVFETGLTYNGTEAQPIVVSGGWDTATNTRVGYTNLGFAQIQIAVRKGAFVFSSGGQYIRFENFMSGYCSLVYYDYVVTVLQKAHFVNCYTGGYGGSGWPANSHSFISMSTANTSLTVNLLRIDDCITTGLLRIALGPARSYPQGEFATNNLVYNDVECVDSLVFYPSYQDYQGRIITNTLLFRSSVPGTYRSILGANSEVQWQLMPASLSSKLRLEDTVIIVRSQSFGLAHQDPTKGLNVELSNVYTTDFGTYPSESYNCTFRHCRSLSLNNVTLGGTSSGGMRIALSGDNTLRSLQPTWPILSITGNFTAASFGGHGGVQLRIPPSTIDIPPASYDSSVKFPFFEVIDSDRKLTITGLHASWLVVGQRSSAVPTYCYPNNPEITIRDSYIGGILTQYNHPLGYVRMFGGSVEKTGKYAGSPTGVYSSSTSTGPAQEAVCFYGTSFSRYSDTRTTDGQYNHSIARHTIWVEGKPTGGAIIPAVTDSSAYRMIHTPVDINVDDTATFGPDSMFSNRTNNRYGHLAGWVAKKANGEFIYKAGASMAYGSADINEYGKRDIRIYGSFRLASYDVTAGSTVQITVRVRMKVVGYIQLMVPPCFAYTASLSGHVVRKNIRTVADDVLVQFSISPQRDGAIDINIYSSQECTVKDLDVVVV